MLFVGFFNVYLNFINEHQLSLEPFTTLLHDDIFFQWTPELDKRLRKFKEKPLSEDADLAISNTNNF